MYKDSDENENEKLEGREACQEGRYLTAYRPWDWEGTVHTKGKVKEVYKL